MTTVEFECVLMTDEEGTEVQMFRAEMGELVAYGRNRAQCLEELAHEHRKRVHEQALHEGLRDGLRSRLRREERL